jgi:SAM-dependent methyltransferase
MQQPTSKASFDPIALAAPMAWRSAPETCEVDPQTGTRCDWYHGLWLYLRLFGINNSLNRQAPQYDETFRRLAITGQHDRVLISGGADYLMAAIVLNAYRDQGAALDLTVLDRCETPLTLNRWYAERSGSVLQTVRADMSTFQAARAFDVIWAHYFLHFVDRRQWPAVIAAWHDALRPGGKLLMVNSLGLSAPEGPINYWAGGAAKLRGQLLTDANLRHAALDIDKSQLVDAIDRYIENFSLYFIRSHDEITDLLIAGGFAIEQATFEPVGRSEGPEEDVNNGANGKIRLFDFKTDGQIEEAWILARRE